MAQNYGFGRLVTVIDTVNPVALCQNVDVYLNSLGNGGTTAALNVNAS